MTFARAGALAVLLAGGCSTLPEIATGECGNGVVEAPEDCDTFAPDASSVCRPAGAAGECHLDCRVQSDGSRPSCPGGWGCDRDGICRAPSGDFAGPSAPVAAGAWSLQSGDFDRDGKADLLSREPLDAYGRSRLRFHYFDENGTLTDTRPFAKLLLAPTIADVSADGRSDLIFSDGRLGVMLGRSDRMWIPETFSSYRVTGATTRMAVVYDDVIEQVASFLALTTLNGVPGFYVSNTNTGKLRLLGAVPAPVESLAGDPASGDVIEGPLSPCRELVYATRGATTFTVMDGCARDPATQEIVWRDLAVETIVALDPAAPIDGAPQIADIDGDGHLDVILGANGRAYVSYGDGQALSAATPYRLKLPSPDEPTADIPMPLAAGDFSGDGVVDFVFDNHILLSRAAAPGIPAGYIVDHVNLGARWTEAKIADLNGNGKLDVVVASSEALGVTFLNGTGTEHMLEFDLATDGPVEHLAVGDLDGDLVNDLAFVEKALGSEDRDSLMIAFGALARPPEAPRAVARVSHAVQITVYYQAGNGNLLLASDEMANGQINGALAELDGSGDRIPFAPYELTSFSSDGSVESSIILGVAVGRFAEGSDDHQALVLASQPPLANPLEFWLVQVRDTPEQPPVHFDIVLDTRLEPLSGSTGFDIHLNLSGAAADLDGDGMDEAIFAMSADQQQHCGLVVVDMTPATLVVRSTIFLDQPCLPGPPLPVDADGDGHLDIAILTGTPGASDHQILVLWNDGTGAFSSGDATIVSSRADSPQAFTVLGAAALRPFGFAYVTDQSASLATTTAPRRFGEPRILAPLQNGSGIVAADLNGDGVTDLALASSGNLSVLLAQLKTP